MNIHITDEKLINALDKSILAKVVVGSHMYGTNNAESDTDYLCIYATSNEELFSFIQTHHQFQVKTTDSDFNYVSLHTFLKNILNGDSTINFEVVQSGILKGTELDWLDKYKDAFKTYTVIRSYLGLCRRDIKHFYKEASDRDKKKRLGHVIRGYIYAKHLINHTFDFDACNEEFKAIEIDISNNDQLKEYDNKVSMLRDILNEKLNSKTLNLPQHMAVDDADKMTEDIVNFCTSSYFDSKQVKGMNMNLFNNAFENWVKY